MTEAQQIKKKNGLCISPGCMKNHAPGRRICHMHYARRTKQFNPIFYTFNALRNNAKRRGRDFTLTLIQFKELIKDSGYMENKGRHSHELQVDRKRALEGYHFDNCQIITSEENMRKRFVDAKIMEYEAAKAGINPDQWQ